MSASQADREREARCMKLFEMIDDNDDGFVSYDVSRKHAAPEIVVVMLHSH